MRIRQRALALLCLALFSTLGASAWTVYYKEQYYRLWHQHYIQYPDDSIENISWLERAKNAAFCNPLYALAKIENERQWERYRYLLDMHLDLKLIESHLALGSKFDKRVAYFYNAPWKRQNLDSLKVAESAYRAALAYWPEAKELASKAMGMRFVDVAGAEFMADEAFRIDEGELDFGKTIQRELERIERLRKEFEAMDSSTY